MEGGAFRPGSHGLWFLEVTKLYRRKEAALEKQKGGFVRAHAQSQIQLLSQKFTYVALLVTHLNFQKQY